LGRKRKEWDNKSGYSGTTNTSSEIELNIFDKDSGSRSHYSADEDDLRIHPLDRLGEEVYQERRQLVALESVQSEKEVEIDEDDGDDDDTSTSKFFL
jgi:hypothetical protein